MLFPWICIDNHLHFAFQVSSRNELLSNDASHRRISIFAFRVYNRCQTTIHEHRFIPLLTGTLGSGRLSGKEKPACSIVGSVICSFVIYMAGVQNSRSKGLYKVGPIGIEKLILHLRYEAGPIGNHAVHKLGASIALAWR